MKRFVHFHHGVDAVGNRCWQLRTTVEVRRCRERHALQPKIVAILRCAPGRELWRNGLHRRRWLLLAAQLRGDRRGFLMTLKRRPLIPQSPPF